MKVSKDILTGLIFFTLGAGAFALATQYRLGSLHAMGPGFFPVILSCVVGACGIFIVTRSFLMPQGLQGLEAVRLKPLAIIVVAVLTFALTIDRFGLIVSIAALVLISRLAMPKRGFVEPILIFFVLTSLAYLVFVVGLNIPLQLGI